MLTPDQMAARYQAAMADQKTVQKYKEGIQGVTKSPMEAAATPEALELYKRKTAESVDSGRRRARLLAVPLEQYKANALAKADRLTSGAKAASGKVTAHFQKWGPIYQQASDAVQGMPKGDAASALNRVQRSMEILMRAAGRTV